MQVTDIVIIRNQ